MISEQIHVYTDIHMHMYKRYLLVMTTLKRPARSICTALIIEKSITPV